MGCCSSKNDVKKLSPTGSGKKSAQVILQKTCSSDETIETGTPIELVVGEPIKSVEDEKRSMVNYMERMDSVGVGLCPGLFGSTEVVARPSLDISNSRSRTFSGRSKSSGISINDLERDSAFAMTKEEFNARTLDLMKATARESNGKYPQISSDQVKHFMKAETDQDREVQASFRSVVQKQQRAQEYATH